jgi:hypothetical protein
MKGQLADLELRHRRRARAEDRIRCAKDTGLANLPLHDFAQNEIWCAIVTLAADLTAWMQTLALTGHEAHRWEPNGCACDCSASRPATPAPAAAGCCIWPPPHRSPPSRYKPSTPSPGSAGQPRLQHRVDRSPSRPDNPRNQPASGTGAHPSDLGRTVTPTCHPHAHAGQEPRRPPR